MILIMVGGLVSQHALTISLCRILRTPLTSERFKRFQLEGGVFALSFGLKVVCLRFFQTHHLQARTAIAQTHHLQGLKVVCLHPTGWDRGYWMADTVASSGHPQVKKLLKF